MIFNVPSNPNRSIILWFLVGSSGLSSFTGGSPLRGVPPSVCPFSPISGISVLQHYFGCLLVLCFLRNLFSLSAFLLKLCSSVSSFSWVSLLTVVVMPLPTSPQRCPTLSDECRAGWNHPRLAVGSPFVLPSCCTGQAQPRNESSSQHSRWLPGRYESGSSELALLQTVVCNLLNLHL